MSAVNCGTLILKMFASEDTHEKYLENGLQKKIPIEKASVDDKMYFLKHLFIYIIVQYFLNCVMTGYLMFTPLLRFHFNENNVYLMSVFIIFALTYCLLVIVSLKSSHHIKWWHHIVLLGHMVSQAITVSVLVAVYEWLSVLSTYLFLLVAFSLLFLFTLQRKMEYRHWPVIIICGVFVIPATIIFQILLHCSDTELAHSISLSAVLFLYHIFSIEVFLRRLCTSDHVKAAILLYVIPQNFIDILKLYIPQLFKSTGS